MALRKKETEKDQRKMRNSVNRRLVECKEMKETAKEFAKRFEEKFINECKESKEQKE